ncbi:hypothetical protein ACYSNM_13495 [Myroides sp. LJL116]
MILIHALDETTKFLSIFERDFKDNLLIFNANDDSEKEVLSRLQDLSNISTIVFLGHGHSSGLYTPEIEKIYPKKIFINKDNGDVILNNKNVILLSCNSNQFINSLTTFNEIIGFGNIISSEREISIEADVTGTRRNLDENDIEFFNATYCNAVIQSLLLFKKGIILFNKIPQYIEFFINKEINSILRKKDIKNSIDIARLLFEFRNEMVYKAK